MTIADTRKKIHGALAGVAVGDAMGMPTEMWPRSRIAKRFGRISDFEAGPDDNDITRGLSPCEVTDDTLITCIIAESIIASGGVVDPRDIIARIKAWAESDSKSTNVLGPSTKRAFEEIAMGVPLEEAGRFGETNGASMRIVPVGAISDPRDIGSLVENVRLACSPTHNTGTAIAGAAAVAAAVAVGVSRDRPSIDAAMDASMDAARLGQRMGYEGFGPSVPRRIALALSIVRGRTDREEAALDLAELIGTGLPSHESVPTAIALAYLSDGDPVACALLSANLGGDTDTIGAMACGICGAHSGIGAFPAETLRRIDEVNGFELGDIAERLTAARRRADG